MARAKKSEPKAYTVLKGCDTADGTRYEPGDVYASGNHSEETTAELIDAGAIEELV
jgi:hypothetical protein